MILCVCNEPKLCVCVCAAIRTARGGPLMKWHPERVNFYTRRLLRSRRITTEGSGGSRSCPVHNDQIKNISCKFIVNAKLNCKSRFSWNLHWKGFRPVQTNFTPTNTHNWYVKWKRPQQIFTTKSLMVLFESHSPIGMWLAGKLLWAIKISLYWGFGTWWDVRRSALMRNRRPICLMHTVHSFLDQPCTVTHATQTSLSVTVDITANAHAFDAQAIAQR